MRAGLLDLAWRNLLHARGRTVVVGCITALVALLVVVHAAFTAGVANGLKRSLLGLQSGHVNLNAFYKTSPAVTWSATSDGEKLVHVVHELAPGATVVERVSVWVRLVSETSSLETTLSGVDLAGEPHLRDLVRATPADVKALSGAASIALFRSQARRLAVSVGDPLTASLRRPNGVVDAVDLRVALVLEDVGTLSAWNALTSRETVRGLLGVSPTAIGSVLVYLQNPMEAEILQARLRARLEADGRRVLPRVPQPGFRRAATLSAQDWTGEAIDLTTLADEIAPMEWVIGTTRTLGTIVLLLVMAVAVLGVSNAMHVAVHERMREITTLRALGLGRFGVLRMVLLEGVILGAVAGVVGASLGLAFALVFNAASPRVTSEALQELIAADRIHLDVRAVHVLFASAAMAILCAVSSIVPAFAAARRSPTEAWTRAE